jgi:glycosyltransferase involved in cell wall biosynthesis
VLGLGKAVVRHALLPVNVSRLGRALRATPLDVLHVVNGGYPGAVSAQAAVIAARRAGCRACVLTVANTPCRRGAPRSAERAVDALVRRSVDAVIVPSAALGRCLAARRGFAPGQMEVIPYGVRESYGAPPAPPGGPGPAAPGDRGAPRDGGPLVGMVAACLPHKGHRHLLEAVARLGPRVPGLRLLLVGDGPTRDDVAAAVRALGLADRVTLLGFRPLPEVVRLIGRLDVLAHPSELEAMPYVILHAMSQGTPVVATDVGAVAEVVLAGRTGLVVPPRDVPALAGALETLATQPALARALGRAGRARYDAEFRLETMVARHDRLYARLAAGAPPAPGAGRAA